MVNTHSVLLVNKKQLTSDVFLFSFSKPEHFSFNPGQFVMIFMENQVEKKWRSYSIASSPETTTIDLLIKIVPDGFASHIWEQVEVGHTFSMKGPFGHFMFDKSTSVTDHCFIATGTGVAPFLSMLDYYLPQYPRSSFTLLFGVRYAEQLCCHEQLLALAQRYPHFTYIPTLSKGEWGGARGRVQQHLTSTTNKIFYICGLKELVLETKTLLEGQGIPAEHIHYERYS